MADTILVKIVKIGESPKEAAVERGATVRSAIVAAGINNPDQYSVRYVGASSEVSLSASLTEDTTIVLTKKENITGGLK